MCMFLDADGRARFTPGMSEFTGSRWTSALDGQSVTFNIPARARWPGETLQSMIKHSGTSVVNSNRSDRSFALKVEKNDHGEYINFLGFYFYATDSCRAA